MDHHQKKNALAAANDVEGNGYEPAAILSPEEEARKVAKLEATLQAKFARLGACLEPLSGGRYKLSYRGRTRFLSDLGQAYELYRQVTEGVK